MKMMILGSRALAALLAASFVSACADDIFTRREARLQVTPVTEGMPYDADVATRTIDLGEVPVYASKTAVFELLNPSTETLIIESITFISTEGERFIINDLAANSARPDSDWPKQINPHGQKAFLEIIYAPTAIGNADIAKVAIKSNAGNSGAGGIIDVTVLGTGGTPLGAPDIEVAYNAYAGPAAEDCATRFDGDTPVIENDGQGNPIINICRPASPLDFGNIGLGAQGTVRLRLRNVAECPEFPGAAACESCALVVNKKPEGQNIGLGFKPGTNDSGVFAFAGSTNTPFSLRQKDIECGEDGEQPLSVEFSAPVVEGLHTAVIVIESNDPDEPTIEIPVRAFARNAPIAVAQFRAFNAAANPPEPWTDPDDIEPLETVYLDGRESYDPRDPEDDALIANYTWEVIDFPPGANTNDFDIQGQGSSLFSMWLPLAGHYVVRLKVTNVDGIESGDTPESRVEFDVIPKEKVHVQLVWDHPSNDQDLHLTLANSPGNDRVCGTWDCHWRSKQPRWFDIEPAGEGPNPRLDIDDTNGIGPENINIDDPESGTYRIYVHHYYSPGGSSSTRNTVRVYINGQQRAEYRRTLTSIGAIWAVGDIVWNNNDATVTPYPSDAANQVGSVATMSTSACTNTGWLFP